MAGSDQFKQWSSTSQISIKRHGNGGSVSNSLLESLSGSASISHATCRSTIRVIVGVRQQEIAERMINPKEPASFLVVAIEARRRVSGRIEVRSNQRFDFLRMDDVASCDRVLD